MSQKVHVKSLRTSIWESSSTAIYAEGTRMSSIWGQLLRARAILYSMYGKGYAYKGIKGRRFKKPVYHFPFVSMHMHHSHFSIYPILATYPRLTLNAGKFTSKPVGFTKPFKEQKKGKLIPLQPAVKALRTALRTAQPRGISQKYLPITIRLGSGKAPAKSKNLMLKKNLVPFKHEISKRSTMILYILIQVLATVVPLLLAVAFLTLCERKIMGAMQRRVGPNVWGFGGLLQPFWDGLKLFLKEPILPSSADQPLFWWAPILAFLTSQAAWAALPTSMAGAVSDLQLGTMYVLSIGSLGVYGVLLAGWASNSKYAFLGCCRSVAQMISYELPLGLVVLTTCVIASSLNWSVLVESQEHGWYLWPLWPMALIWGVCCLAETNRAPFDLPEAEAELVAGYNVEYASIGFALFFIAEYANMILMGTITSLLFLGGTASPIFLLSFIPGSFWLAVKTALVVFGFVWVRATLPRYRFDQLQALCWKRFLPLTLAGFVANAAIIFVFQLAPSIYKNIN